MSAFLVSRSHIAYLVNALSHFDGFHTYMPEECEKIGQELWSENARSVAYRYPDEPAELVRYTRHRYAEGFEAAKLSPVQTLKLVNCLEYQSCEHPGWTESQAFRLCGEIRSVAIAALPGYEAAAWALEGY